MEKTIGQQKGVVYINVVNGCFFSSNAGFAMQNNTIKRISNGPAASKDHNAKEIELGLRNVILTTLVK